jgi:hypothetical protein
MYGRYDLEGMADDVDRGDANYDPLFAYGFGLTY